MLSLCWAKNSVFIPIPLHKADSRYFLHKMMVVSIRLPGHDSVCGCCNIVGFQFANVTACIFGSVTASISGALRLPF